MSSDSLIWLSDLHFEHQGNVLGHDPRARLDAAVDHINTHFNDASLCVITGDMVETATAANYRAVRAALDRLEVPWVPMTGNHDDCALFLEHFDLPPGARDAMPGFAQYVIERPGLRLICLDSLRAGSSAGELCAARLDWLESALSAAPDTPALVFLHHPPVPLGLPMLDADRLIEGEALIARLQRHGNVRHLCFGHVHRPTCGTVGGIAYASIRSVLYQAPPPEPAWTWDTFAPAHEAPELGVIRLHSGQVSIRFHPFCDAAVGVAPA